MLELCSLTVKDVVIRLDVPWQELFLVADTQIYKRLCPSVRPSVRLSSGRTSILETSVCECEERGIGWGVSCEWGIAAQTFIFCKPSERQKFPHKFPTLMSPVW